MNCKQVKRDLALLVGNDLEPRTAEEVHRHLHRCGDCRQHLTRLTGALEALQGPASSGGADGWNAEADSLWPKLSTRLAAAPPQKPHRMSGWAPTLAVAAACTAMFWVASRSWVADTPSDPLGLPAAPVQSISEPGPGQISPIPAPPPPFARSTTNRVKCADAGRLPRLFRSFRLRNPPRADRSTAFVAL